jgi:hypothetical protein
MKTLIERSIPCKWILLKKAIEALACCSLLQDITESSGFFPPGLKDRRLDRWLTILPLMHAFESFELSVQYKIQTITKTG